MLIEEFHGHCHIKSLIVTTGRQLSIYSIFQMFMFVNVQYVYFICKYEIVGILELEPAD